MAKSAETSGEVVSSDAPAKVTAAGNPLMPMSTEMRDLPVLQYDIQCAVEDLALSAGGAWAILLPDRRRPGTPDADGSCRWVVVADCPGQRKQMEVCLDFPHAKRILPYIAPPPPPPPEILKVTKREQTVHVRDAVDVEIDRAPANYFDVLRIQELERQLTEAIARAADAVQAEAQDKNGALTAVNELRAELTDLRMNHADVLNQLGMCLARSQNDRDLLKTERDNVRRWRRRTFFVLTLSISLISAGIAATAYQKARQQRNSSPSTGAAAAKSDQLRRTVPPFDDPLPDWRDVSRFSPMQEWDPAWGEQEESNKVFWWKIRFDNGWKIAGYLQPRREILLKLVESFPEHLPEVLRADLEDFNQEVEFGYTPDYFRMFGKDRPEGMPSVLHFKPLPKIETIETGKR